MSSNKLVVCPYDEAHKVKESRIQLHITKCRQNHLSDLKFVCPFNATHVYPNQEKNYHLMRCPDQGLLVRQKANESVNRNNPFKGRTAVPSYSEAIPADSSEVWEVEESFEPTAGYVPTKEAPSGTIVEPKPLSKPADRRQLYKELHQMPSEFDKKSHSYIPPPSVPRQPKQQSEVDRNSSESNCNLQNLGLGRGRPPASRIAANIFPRQPEVSSAGSSYSSAISGIRNLNIGRGSTNRAPFNQPILNDDDFPALGLGRGISKKSQKEEIKFPGTWA